MLDQIDVILHRPQLSENIGATARAMKNFGLSNLVLVSPLRYEASKARTVAVHSEEILNNARRAQTLDDAIAPYALVIPTTERALIGREPPVSPREAAKRLLEVSQTGRVALLFGEEASGLSTPVLARFPCYASIPSSPERRSLNLAQAVLLFAWELYQEADLARLPVRDDPARPNEQPASLQLVSLLREHARRLLLGAGFLNPQQPDRTMDELMRLLQRAQPTQREIEMLLAAVSQLERTSIVPPR